MGTVRIIAGTLRGRRIPVPSGDVRPTSDRAREGLFSVLAGRLADARVLDLFAGSGALGFEALSRGAESVVFVERDQRVSSHLRQQAARLDLTGRTRVLQGDAVAFLARGLLEGPFDLILADPPYGESPAEGFVPAALSLLSAEGMLVLERAAAGDPYEPPGGALKRTVRYGRTSFDLLIAGPG